MPANAFPAVIMKALRLAPGVRILMTCKTPSCKDVALEPAAKRLDR
jgi:hypothetical protein